MMRPGNAIWNHGAKCFSQLGWLVCVFLLLALPALASVNVPLVWDPSSDANVVGYKIYYGVASHNYTNSVNVGNVTNTTITGLSENVTYYFAATTYAADGGESDFSNEASYSVNTTTNNPPPVVYQPPTLDALNNVSINENSGQQTVNLTGISLGSGQTLAIAAVSSNPSLIPNPAVNYTSPNATGTLSFTPASSAFGTASITVTADNGQAQSNLVTRTFTVTVAASSVTNTNNDVATTNDNVAVINPLPTMDPISDLNMSYCSAAQTVALTGIKAGVNNLTPKIKITVKSSNSRIVPNPKLSYASPGATGTLTVKPAAKASGSAVITVTINDGGKSNNIVTRTFTVTVAPNQPPTLNSISGLVLAKNAAAQTVNLSGISAGAPGEIQKLKITAKSSNTKLVPNPKVGYVSPGATGFLTLQPTGKTNGIAFITVTVNDGAKTNNLFTQTFAVTVLPDVSSATNNAGAASAVVAPPAAMLSSPARTNGHFSFQVNGTSGNQYAVQASDDLIHWTTVQTNTAPFAFEDADAAQHVQRFYRTVEVHAP